MDLKRRIEALLFVASEPMSVRDLAIPLQESGEAVSRALKAVMKDYATRETALKISRNGIRYRMELKEEYIDLVGAVSAPEFPKESQELLSMVIANDGIMRGEVTKRFGDRSESILNTLKRHKIITSEKYRNTEIFKIGKNFYTYFSVSRDELRDIVNKQKDDSTVK